MQGIPTPSLTLILGSVDRVRNGSRSAVEAPDGSGVDDVGISPCSAVEFTAWFLLDYSEFRFSRLTRKMIYVLRSQLEQRAGV